MSHIFFLVLTWNISIFIVFFPDQRNKYISIHPEELLELNSVLHFGNKIISLLLRSLIC